MKHGGAAVSVVDADDAAVRAARHDEVLALKELQMERNFIGEVVTAGGIFRCMYRGSYRGTVRMSGR